MFREDFVWGAATSAYQIEGGAFEDGKGLSIWDEFCMQDGRIFQGHTGETACDHYHRFREDVALMSEMGLKAYRFSISWTRILPEGTGRVEPRGVQFYKELICELKKCGITPYVTLHHWDYPAALMKKGGWLNPDSPLWFEEYTEVIAREFGDTVHDFITFNEPEMMFGNSFVTPNLAPGYSMAEGDVVKMIHHMLLAHGKAVKVLRRQIPDVKVGVTLCSDPVIPEKEEAEKLDAVAKYYFRAGENIEELAFGLSWYGDPMMIGKYPEDGLKRFGKYLPQGWEEDLKEICQPLDYQGHNVYCGMPVRFNACGEAVQKERKPGAPRTAIGWPIDPETLYWGPKLLYERYHLPVIITENGLSCHDVISLDRKVHDPNRIDYLHRYLLELSRAIEVGIPVLGYFQWSFMDNFEWAKGYDERFGLVYVDFESQERIRKDSSYWYEEVIKTNGDNL